MQLDWTDSAGACQTMQRWNAYSHTHSCLASELRTLRCDWCYCQQFSSTMLWRCLHTSHFNAHIFSNWMLTEDTWVHVAIVIGTAEVNMYANGQVAKYASIDTGTRLIRYAVHRKVTSVIKQVICRCFNYSQCIVLRYTERQCSCSDQGGQSYTEAITCRLLVDSD
jgi:hypothetical protein